MNLKVKLLDQSVHELDVDPNTLISDLRAVLEATLNIPADRQRLIYRGRVLRDENTLHELGVENGNTIHLVERPANAPEPAAAGAPSAGGSDLNRLLQGMLSALGGVPPAGAAGAQQHQPAPPHLLQSIAQYLQQLSSPASSSSSFPGMPVTSLAPGLPPASTAGGQQLQQALLTALQQILQGQSLTLQQQAQLQQAGAGPSAMPSTQLVLAALSVLLSRAEAYITGPFASALHTASQQLAEAGQQQQLQPAAANQLLANTSGQLQAAAALLVELARAASATSLAAQGNPVALSCNMAAVLRERTAGGLEPSFPTLYPHTTLSQAGTAAATGAASRSGPAAADGTTGQQQHPSSQRIAEMVAAALSSSLAPVLQQASAEVETAVRVGRSQVASGQFEAATAAARATTTSHVSSTVARVLNVVTDAINTNVRNIEQRLQQVEQQAGREANAGDIASAVQQVLLPNLQINLQPLGDVLGAAARAAASSTAAANAAAQAAQAAQAAAAAASAQAAAQAATAATAAAAATPPAAPAAAAATAAPATEAAAATAGPSSSGGVASSSQQPRGLGVGLKSGALPAKRKAASTPAADAAGPEAEAGGAASSTPFAGASTSGNISGSGTGAAALIRKATPGVLRLSETGRANPSSHDPGLVSVDEAAEDGDGVEAMEATGGSSNSSSMRMGGQQQQQQPPDMAALMDLMGGMFAGPGAVGGAGAPTSAATASMGHRGAAAAPRAAGLPAVPAAGGGAGAGDLSGLMQMVGGMLGGPGPGGAAGGGAGAGGGGGMAGLLQMAGQIASDPAMQPLMNNIASSLLGGGGPGAGAGGAGGLGSLLSGLLGAPPPGGMGGVRAASRNRGSATVVVGMDDLEHELPAETAAQWRRILEEDARAQAGMLAQGRGPLSEVYLAGAPVKKQSLIPGSS